MPDIDRTQNINCQLGGRISYFHDLYVKTKTDWNNGMSACLNTIADKITGFLTNYLRLNEKILEEYDLVVRGQ